MAITAFVAARLESLVVFYWKLKGDPAKAKAKLGWTHETKWQQLCAEMVAADLITVAKEQRRNAE